MDKVDKVLDMFAALTAKLGQAAGTLWPSAVRYVALEALWNIVIAMLGVAIMSAAFVYAQRYKYNPTSDRDDSEYAAKCLTSIGLMASIIVLCVVMVRKLPIVMEPVGHLTMRILGQ